VNLYTKRDGDTSFVFPARETASAEVSPFSAEVTVNCAPPV